MTGPVNDPSTRSRREARERAVELAYEAHVRGLAVEEIVTSLPIAPEPFVVDLLSWAEQRRSEADELIRSKASGWKLERMPILDLVVMRIAVAELLATDTPRGVVLSEAVELAGRYSTEESSRFVNGVLAAIDRELAGR